MSTTIETVIDDLNFATTQISEQTRTISIGVLAIAWLFLSGGKDAPAVKVAPDVFVLLSAGALAIASLLADYFQYLCAFVLSKQVLNAFEEVNLHCVEEKPQYNYDSPFFIARQLFFWLKQAACLLATAILIYAIVNALL